LINGWKEMALSREGRLPVIRFSAASSFDFLEDFNTGISSSIPMVFADSKVEEKQ
jgi:hypothetical protein